MTFERILMVCVALLTIAGIVYTFIQGGRSERRIATVESNHLATLETRVNNLYTLFGEVKKILDELKTAIAEDSKENLERHNRSDVDRGRMDERIKAIEEKIP